MLMRQISSDGSLNQSSFLAMFGVVTGLAGLIVSAERVVFNIKGNDYRLVVAINYAFQVVLIKWLGTHKEYDNIAVEQVTYDEDRYADPTN